MDSTLSKSGSRTHIGVGLLGHHFLGLVRLPDGLYPSKTWTLKLFQISCTTTHKSLCLRWLRSGPTFKAYCAYQMDLAPSKSGSRTHIGGSLLGPHFLGLVRLPDGLQPFQNTDPQTFPNFLYNYPQKSVFVVAPFWANC
jgi:hypothetical protein